MGSILKQKPYLLKNLIQHYPWGSVGKNAYIPRLLDIPSENDTPYAELWIGAHPKAPSKVVGLEPNSSLFDLQNSGDLIKSKTSTDFPYLLKVLSADQSLSIQTHPNKEQAKILHKNDPEHYPDANHKPEIAIALDNLVALAGFRPADEIKEVINNYPPLAKLLGEHGSRFISNTDQEKDQSLFKLTFIHFIRTSVAKPDLLTETLDSIGLLIGQKKSPDTKEQLFIDLKKQYSGADTGLISLFFLNHTYLESGEAIFIDAGTPHAYLKGNIVECMANSDNVVRAGLTPKFQDANTLIDILDYRLSKPQIIKKNIKEKQFIYPTPVDDFEISSIHLDINDKYNLVTEKKPVLLLIIEGELSVSTNDKIFTYRRGDTILFPWQLESCTLLAKEKTLAFMVRIPD